MQDNYPNIDKKFTDKGWAAMRDLLDEELPVDPPKRKRRGLVFILLFVGMVIGIAIGVIAGGVYFEKNHQEAQKTTNQPIANQETSDNLQENKNTVNAQASSELQGKTNGNNTNLSFEKTTESEQKIENRVGEVAEKGENATQKNNVKPFKNVNSSVQLNTKAAENNAIVEGNPSDDKIDETNPEIAAANENNTTVKVLKNKELGMLDVVLEDPVFAVKLPELNNQEEANSDKKDNNKGRLGLELGLIGASKYLGISGGLVYAKLFNDKWSVQVGANYAYQQRTFQGEAIPASQLILEDTEINYPGLGDSLSNLLQGNYDENIARSDSAIFTIPQKLGLHYLNIPIRVNYHLNKKWSIGAGVTGSLLLLATNNYTDGGVFNRSSDNLFNEEDVSFNVLDEQKSVNKANLQKYDLAANIGIGFHPSPKWSLTANYQHGFNNLFKYSSDTAYNRYFNIGIQYYFGK